MVTIVAGIIWFGSQPRRRHHGRKQGAQPIGPTRSSKPTEASPCRYFSCSVNKNFATLSLKLGTREVGRFLGSRPDRNKRNETLSPHPAPCLFTRRTTVAWCADLASGLWARFKSVDHKSPESPDACQEVTSCTENMGSGPGHESRAHLCSAPSGTQGRWLGVSVLPTRRGYCMTTTHPTLQS